ncbi:hypothetical protein BST63_02810 [Bradyrhizobium canariense]|uniref:ABC transporter domain-containing protein n=1 Tax=Bradyrhizobium canariense TaxID=255045 RepID=A0ABX3XAJ1_9BRAD|nr:ABC transporter ATP-binding protein [Bradyrhizobium canariense]OSJ19438.1 hypothetical protein BSR47_02905 [Bradyrhizobium canariense]OSJ34902.1 hypothetical protein BST63_02810 [Bradyrhizobium canariense]
MSTSIEIKNLSRKFGSFHALRNVTLSVTAGEFVTLLGPSGSGKSTVLKLLAGFDQPTSGEILLGGRSMLGVMPHLRNVGMVFQNYALFPHMTVFDNIAFPLRVRNEPTVKIEDKVASVLDLTRMNEYRHRYPSELSGGQQQRVALARAIVFDPKVLLMDEPLGALDRHLREQLKFEIKRIQRQFNMTVLFVTHDQDEALVMSDRVVVMREGAIEQEASPHEIYARPVTRFVADFLGESNILAGELHQGHFVFGGGKLNTPKRRSQADGPCWIMIRPEFIDIEQGEELAGLSGTLREAIYLGESTRYIVDCGGSTLIVKRQNRIPLGLEAGCRVCLRWDAKDSVVLTR